MNEHFLPFRRLLFEFLRRVIGFLLLGGAASAQAHSDTFLTGGFVAGYLHPLTGLDHMLAMIAVGVWGAILGRPFLWALPLSFMGLMVVGSVLGISGVAIPFVETGVVASVVILGLTIVAAWQAPIAVAGILVAIFGLFHGYAHGAEIPSAATPVAYSVGFLVSTGLLQLAGIGIGSFKALRHGVQTLRAVGVLIAAAGLWIFLGMPGVG